MTNFKDGMRLVEVTGLAPEEYERVINAAKEEAIMLPPIVIENTKEGKKK